MCVHFISTTISRKPAQLGFAGGSPASVLTFSQVDDAVLAAQWGLDLDGEAHLFADQLLAQELSGLKGPRLQHRARRENMRRRRSEC